MGAKNVFYFIAAMGVVANCLRLGGGPNKRCGEWCQMVGGSNAEPLTADDINHDSIVVIGSAVAAGGGEGTGWPFLLQDLVREKNQQKNFVFDAISGFNMKKAKDRWANNPAFDNASAVIISLSLGNEGIAKQTAEQQKETRDSWLSEMKKFADSFKIPVFLGGVYPRGNSTEVSQEETPIGEHLLECNRVMKTWKYPLFDFLPATDDGTGAWRAGLMHDKTVPNSFGHQAMVNAITPKQIDMLAGLA